MLGCPTTKSPFRNSARHLPSSFLPIHIENPVPKSVEITHSKCNSLNRLNQVVTAFCESIGVWLDNCLNNCSLPIFKRS